jgi:hypothetical protein
MGRIDLMNNCLGSRALQCSRTLGGAIRRNLLPRANVTAITGILPATSLPNQGSATFDRIYGGALIDLRSRFKNANLIQIAR